MSPTEVIAQQRELELPAGWARTKFGEIYELAYGKSLTKGARNTDGKYPVYGSNGIVGHHDAFLVEGPALVVGRKGAAGAVSFSTRPCWPIDTTYYLRESEHIDIRFSFYLLTSLRLNQFDRSTAIPGLNRDDAYDLVVRLPPLSEQNRIVAKIEELFCELDKGVESLKTARGQLNVYRQAVLKHAFEGKLTAQWREENEDKLETPEQLLARIKQERAGRYEQQLQEWKAAGKTWEESGEPSKRPARPSKLKEISQLSLTETEILPSLPDGWSYLRLGFVINEPKYGTSKKCDYNYEGTGVLRIPNVVRGVVDASDLKGAHFEEDEKRTHALRNGDILVIRSNGSISIVGKCAIISKAEEQYLYAGYLIRLRSNPRALLPDYLAALLSSHLLRTQIEHKAKSTSGVNNINSGEIQSLIVPLCGLSEQEVVVERLSASLSAIEGIEAELDNQLPKAVALRQSILKKAFAGQLVAQDPSDEPASVLLDRIKAEKKQASRSRETTKRIRKKRTGA